MHAQQLKFEHDVTQNYQTEESHAEAQESGVREEQGEAWHGHRHWPSTPRERLNGTEGQERERYCPGSSWTGCCSNIRRVQMLKLYGLTVIGR